MISFLLAGVGGFYGLFFCWLGFPVLYLFYFRICHKVLNYFAFGHASLSFSVSLSLSFFLLCNSIRCFTKSVNAA